MMAANFQSKKKRAENPIPLVTRSIPAPCIDFFSVLAYFLWKLENPKPMEERRFFKRYLTFWHLYNLFADFFFLIGLLMKLLEILSHDSASSVHGLVDMNNLAAGGRILWGAAFSLAILKTIKVRVKILGIFVVMQSEKERARDEL